MSKFIELTDFLENTPPNVRKSVKPALRLPFTEPGLSSTFLILDTPDITLLCDDGMCKGKRLFKYVGNQIKVVANSSADAFLVYQCKNCEKSKKTFSVNIKHNKLGNYASVIKYGEFPVFGPSLPSSLVTLVRDERDFLLKGLRSESQGLGIAAFAYYRRVVESQKNRIFDKIITVAQASRSSVGVIEELQKAKRYKQFSRSLEVIKKDLPQEILIGGTNPLNLLHNAISVQLHAGSDEECLEFAHDIRMILTELSENLAQALKDRSELKEAVKRLQDRKKSNGGS